MTPGKLSKKTKNDIILAAAILLIAAAVSVYLNFFVPTGDSVSVTLDGKLYGTYPLEKDAALRIEKPDGSFNTIIIKNGQVYIEEASCPDRICQKHAPISKDGEAIVCLPNRLVVSVSAKRGGEVDVEA